MTNRSKLAKRFENIFRRLLAREKFDPDEKDLSLMFEVIATKLLAEVRERHIYFDGVVNLTSRIRKPRQVEFKGEMWVGGGNTQWKEDFRAIVTDKQTTKQGIWITIWIGSDRAEGELLSAFGAAEEAEHNATFRS